MRPEAILTLEKIDNLLKSSAECNERILGFMTAVRALKQRLKNGEFQGHGIKQCFVEIADLESRISRLERGDKKMRTEAHNLGVKLSEQMTETFDFYDQAKSVKPQDAHQSKILVLKA